MSNISIIVRGQMYGQHFDEHFFADPSIRKDGKYKYFVVLQDDDSFTRHPFRAAVFINSKPPSHCADYTQYPLRNIKKECIHDPEIIDHGYIDLSFVFMVSVKEIK